ncbi:hypothetical protein, partial [Aestuariivirga sp.]|uniref:hypothetical protein n=1 Tax=Aestuariivirga sp. TaxID=2650926 RepID=UPI0037852D29
IDGCGSFLHGVALHLGLNTPSLRLEESNANLTPNFYIDRDIPKLNVSKGLAPELSDPGAQAILWFAKPEVASVVTAKAFLRELALKQKRG